MIPTSSIENIRSEYLDKWFIFINGETIKEILTSSYWVKDEDFKQLQKSWEDLQDDPTMPRKSANGRFGINYNNSNISTLSQTSFILEEKDWFKRVDSWKKRDFIQINQQVQNNKAFQWLLRLQADIIKNIKLPKNKELIEDISKQLCTVFQIRTIKKSWPQENIYEWEPAPEWAHCDIGLNKWHIATILINSQNLWRNSGISILLDKNEENISSTIWTQYNNINQDIIKAKVQHKNPFDILFFIDTPHAVSAINKENPGQVANRDMILLMTRRYKQWEDQTHDNWWVSFWM